MIGLTHRVRLHRRVEEFLATTTKEGDVINVPRVQFSPLMSMAHSWGALELIKVGLTGGTKQQLQTTFLTFDAHLRDARDAQILCVVHSALRAVSQN